MAKLNLTPRYSRKICKNQEGLSRNLPRTDGLVSQASSAKMQPFRARRAVAQAFDSPGKAAAGKFS